MFSFSGSLELSAEGKGQYSVYLHSAWRLDADVSFDMFMSKEECQVTDYFVALSLLQLPSYLCDSTWLTWKVNPFKSYYVQKFQNCYFTSDLMPPPLPSFTRNKYFLDLLLESKVLTKS
jgi:hypothetical protein